MMDILKLRRFLSNDFNNAILSIKEKNGEIIPHLNLIEKSQLDERTIGIYSENIKQMRKEPLRLCRYMLDSFLENNTVLGINYSYNNPNYPSNKCFDIITIKGIFTIAIGNVKLNDIFPNFIEKLESAKHKGIMETVVKSNFDEKRKFFLTFDNTKTITGYDYNSYQMLMLKSKGKFFVPKFEYNFTKKVVKELIEMYTNFNDYNALLCEIDRIKQFKKYKNCNRFQNVFLSAGKIKFELSEDKFEFQINLLEEVVRELVSEIDFEESKQLVITYGGKRI